MQASLLLENIKDQAYDALRLLVRFELVIAVGPPHVAHRRMMQEVTALGLVSHALQHAAFEDMQFRFAHHATESQRMRLAHIHHRLSSQVMVVEFWRHPSYQP